MSRREVVRHRQLVFVFASLVLAWILPAGAEGAPAAPDTVVTYPATGEEISIVRDARGVPHVYAPSAEAASYGVAWAAGQDRLWEAHLLRLVFSGRFSELLGPVVVQDDKVIRLRGYTAGERARKFARLPADVQAEFHAYAAGLKDYAALATTNPALLPVEFVEFGVLPIPPFTVDDMMAAWDLITWSPSDVMHA
ncbi:MAG: penicillin acylase family protein, partial [Candidatus Binatia bacterium]